MLLVQLNTCYPKPSQVFRLPSGWLSLCSPAGLRCESVGPGSDPLVAVGTVPPLGLSSVELLSFRCLWLTGRKPSPPRGSTRTAACCWSLAGAWWVWRVCWGLVRVALYGGARVMNTEDTILFGWVADAMVLCTRVDQKSLVKHTILRAFE